MGSLLETYIDRLYFRRSPLGLEERRGLIYRKAAGNGAY